MAFAFFSVPIQDEGGQAARDLNQFLASHRIVSIERSLIEQGSNSRWSFCIEYSSAVTLSQTASSSMTRASVDYKAILPAEEFQWFSLLRDWRSTLAKSDSIPPYLIFNNQQLVQIIQERMTTKADLLKIPNVGSAKVEKYGDSILEQVHSFWGVSDATGG
jgi:superfamily II DNA helicase RecQ